jgi:hypothetical protein
MFHVEPIQGLLASDKTQITRSMWASLEAKLKDMGFRSYEYERPNGLMTVEL